MDEPERRALVEQADNGLKELEATDFASMDFPETHAADQVLAAGRLLDKAGESQRTQELQWELDALRFSPSWNEILDWDRKEELGPYFHPFMTGTRTDGTPVRHPDPSRVDAAMLAHLHRRALATNNPVLRNRYLDIVLDFRKVATPMRIPDLVRAVVEGHLELARARALVAGHELSVCEHLARAIQLCITFNQPALGRLVLEMVVEWSEGVAGQPARVHPLNAARLLWAARKFHDPAVPPDPLTRARDVLRRAVEAARGNPDPWFMVDRLKALERVELIRGDAEAARNAIVETAKAFEAQADRLTVEGGHLLAADAYEQSHKAFRDAGMREEAERLVGKVRSSSAAASGSFATVSAEVDIPKEVTEGAQAELLAGSTREILERLADHRRWVRNLEDLQAEAQETMEAAPLFTLLTRKKMHRDFTAGKVQGGVDSPGLWKEQVAQHLSFEDHLLLVPVFRALRERGVTPEEIVAWLEERGVADAACRATLTRGIRAVLEGDFIVASSILAPQCERGVRNALRVAGREVVRSDEDTFEFKTLGRLLRDNSDLLGAAFVLYLETCLTDSAHLNLRNLVCHGDMTDAEFEERVAVRLLHVLLLLAGITPPGPPAEGQKAH